jgi:hypothetical protein
LPLVNPPHPPYSFPIAKSAKISTSLPSIIVQQIVVSFSCFPLCLLQNVLFLAVKSNTTMTEKITFMKVRPSSYKAKQILNAFFFFFFSALSLFMTYYSTSISSVCFIHPCTLLSLLFYIFSSLSVLMHIVPFLPAKTYLLSFPAFFLLPL